jgi:acetyl esterase/lipase
MIEYHATNPLVTGIDPDIFAAQRQVNTLLSQMPHPDLRTLDGLAALRAGTANNPGGTQLTPADRTIPGPGGDLRVRIFAPNAAVRAVMLRIHGGGWAAGSPEDDDVLNDTLARACGIAVISPEYRLVPDVTIHDQIADCITAASWTGANARRLYGTDTLLVGGISAGAYLAASTLLALRDTASPAFAHIAGAHLDCGVYDLGGTPSAITATDQTMILTHDWIYDLIDLGLPGTTPEQRRIPELSPVLRDLSGLPPVLFTVGDLDPLRDDSILMATRWQLAGSAAYLDVWPEGAHAFTNMATPLGALAEQRAIAWIRNLPNPSGAR